MYEILLERSAERDLKSLPKAIFVRILSSIKALATMPRPVGCRKIIGSQVDWRIRAGDYRILYEINDKQREVRIYRVKHRRDAYR